MSAPPLVILLVKLQFASLSLYNTCRPDIHHNLMVFSWDKFSKWPWKITQPHSSFFWLLVLWPSTPHQAQSVVYLTVTVPHLPSYHTNLEVKFCQSHECLKEEKSPWETEAAELVTSGMTKQETDKRDYKSDDPWHWWNAQLGESCKHWRLFWITMNMSRQKTPDRWKGEG